MTIQLQLHTLKWTDFQTLIRTSFVKKYQEDGKLIIKFVMSEDNEADIFTKNRTNVMFHNHQKKLVWDKSNVDNEMKQELTQNESQQEGC